MAGPVGPMWFDPAPPGYPWTLLLVPVNIRSREEAEKLVGEIKEAGNRSLRRGDHYDALWKYSHALVLCRDHSLPTRKISVISSNCAQACLYLRYHGDAFSHANDAITTDPNSPIIDKAYYRRAEAAKFMYDGLVKGRHALAQKFADASMEGAIQDYWHCFCLKDTNTRAVCEAIILSVAHSSILVPMVFLDRDIESGATTRILHELLARDEVKHAHLNFLLHRITFQTVNPDHFDCSEVKFSTVCKISLGKRVLTTLLGYGMEILPEDVEKAVKILSDSKSDTLDLIASNCEGLPRESLSLAYVAAERLGKGQLLGCLKKRGAVAPPSPQEEVSRLKAEGNDFFHHGQYDDALAKYYKALAVCQQRGLEREEALIRGNCAQACIELELLRDGYDHANECLRLDPESSKGHYRRAEALKKMLDDGGWRGRVPEGKSFADVVQDYFQCHRKTEDWSMKAIHQAICVATNHECTKSLPKLTPSEITSGLATAILTELTKREDSEQKHFSTLLFTLLPEDAGRDTIDVTSLQVSELLEKKSVTSAKLIRRLISLGMKVNEMDVSLAVKVLKDHHKKTLQLLAKECARTRKSNFTSACQEAIKAKKLQFVACLIENGGAPDVEDLKDVTGWPQAKVEPAIDEYLQEHCRSKKKKKKGVEVGREESPPSGLPDPAQALVSIRREHGLGRTLLKAGQPLLAEQKFRDALALCVLYGFAEELSEIYHSLAELHLQFGRHETAFQYCTEALQQHPTPKVYYLRAIVLQSALATPFVTVPRSINPGIVVSDFCNCHRLEDNLRALTEAIVFAVDNRLTPFLKDRKLGPLMTISHIKSGFTTDLLVSLLEHEKTKEAHVKLLLFEIPIHSKGKSPFDGSQVPLSMLISKKVTNSKIVKALLDTGMTVDEADVKQVIETTAGDGGSTATLDLLCSRLEDVSLDKICQMAVASKKARFVLCLLKKGCSLPCSSQEILALALEKNLPDVAESLLPHCTLTEVDLGQLMSDHRELGNHKSLVVKMVDGGVNPGGLSGKKPLVEVLKMDVSSGKKVELLCVLIEKGCDCAQLCAAYEWTTTPIHVAVTIGIDAGGSTRVLDAVVASKTFSTEDYEPFIDGKGSTPLHLAVNSVKKEHSFKLVKALIETHKLPIDPSIHDRHGKRVIDYMPGKKDKRLPFISMAASIVQQLSSRDKKEKVNGEQTKAEEEKETADAGNSSSTTNTVSKDVVAPGNDSMKKPVKRLNSYEMMSPTEKIELHLKVVLGKDTEYFMPETTQKPCEEMEEDGSMLKVVELKQVVESDTQGKRVEVTRKSLSPQPPTVTEVVGTDETETDMATVMSQFGLEDFDGLPWEVEVTNSVLKFFKNEKKHPYSLRLRAARTVYELAEGKRSRELSKEVSSSSSNLFEAKLSKGGRIIWQVAVQFSPRRTERHCNPIYAQVIRVWEIVPDHDQLTQTIKDCVKQIERSNERGLKASLNVALVPQRSRGSRQKQQKLARQQAKIHIPKIFTQADVESPSGDDSIERYTPAASPKEDEFNVTTFYSFSGAVLKSMLTGSDTRRDFPFKEWPKEHEIINLPPDIESILLLGRSGTGKTTCCLYRLWNEFKAYWDHPEVVKLPRRPLVAASLPVAREDEQEDEGVNSSEEGLSELTEGDSTATHTHTTLVSAATTTAAPPVSGVVEETTSLTQKDHKPSEAEEEDQEEDDEHGNEVDDDDEPAEPASDAGESSDDQQAEEIEEHLHQVFVTKNYVLCAQMKRRFYDMAAAHDSFAQHMDWETKELPHSFAEIDDFAYPLFLTARQFYILLDNSISDEQRFFRPRDRDGGLRVKIVSSDYDHEDPDTLLDLEDSDSEGEEPNSGDHTLTTTTAATTKHHAQSKYVEVTSLYFTEKIWPNISQRCNARHLDPLLVWLEIQSFIKGSRPALLRGSALLLDEYRHIGNKMAPNFAGERETIYALYCRYEEFCQNKRHSVFLFDECDLVHSLHRRLRAVRDLPWSIHSLYIDEVQDFTQAELALYLHCCRHPNSLFFTGDTAQSIMRGIAFRFQDLRSSFHAIHEVVPQVKVPQQPHTLTINFRSHSGILRLAGSIIDLLQTFFKGSIDHLPADRGMFPGPTPVVLASCEEGDLALLLSSSKRESSRIEFGAHQVVLVQSKEAKESLPSMLKGAIVLTIFESKGLEFDDVLLYNFFHDSMVDEKGWRVVTSYLEEHADCIKNKGCLPGSSSHPRSNKFDERSHKALNSELKYLYTAITRAKCNLWIYDSNPKKRLPIFDLWYRRDLVKVVGEGLEGAESQHSLIFAAISTEVQWKAQGDYFMRRSRWEQARHCYDRAGEENLYLSVEANARFVVQQASKLAKPQLYMEAAAGFLYRDQLAHSVQCLLFAAQCLRRARPQKLSSAAALFERLGKYGEALKCYRKIKDTKNCVRLLEMENRYDEAVRMFRAPKEALAKAVEYTRRGIELSPELLPDNLSYMYASQCAKRRDKTTLVEMLQYMSDPSRRARFLKICGLYQEALKEYVDDDELDDAYRLASGQGLLSEGREIAKKHDDPKKEAEFLFHQIHAELAKSRERGSELVTNIKMKSWPLASNFKEDLQQLKKSNDSMIKATACLLLGTLTGDAALCRSAHIIFLQHNKAAALEAFDAWLSLSDHKPPLDRVLTACATAKEVEHALRSTSDLNQLVKQATAFYGVSKIRDMYLTPPNHNMWLSSRLKSECLVKNEEEKDIDGMLRLDVASTREVLASYIGSFIDRWLKENGTERKIQGKLKSFKLHDSICRRYLPRLYMQNEVPPQQLMEYLMALINNCKLIHILGKKTNVVTVDTLLTVFSPQVSLHLPLTEQHVVLIRNAKPIHKQLNEAIKYHTDPEHLNRMDKWFSAWRACCLTVSDSSTTLLDSTLQALEEKVKQRYENKSQPSSDISFGVWMKNGRFKVPHTYLYWKLENRYYHVFNFWLYSCNLVSKEKKALWAAKHAIYHFLGTITQRKFLSISVIELVYVLIVHCTGLFATLTQLNHHQKNMSAKFVIPVHYQACVTLFDTLNCKKDDFALLSASTSQANRAVWWGRHTRLRNQCTKLLNAALSILLGRYHKDPDLPPEEQKNFKVLKYAFRNEKVVDSGAARHCLVLALTLFANLLAYQHQHKWEAAREDFVSFFNEASTLDRPPPFLKDGRDIFHSLSTAQTLQSKVFQYVGQLLREISAKGTATQAMMMTNDKGKITYAPLLGAEAAPTKPQQSASTRHGPVGSVQQSSMSEQKFPVKSRQSGLAPHMSPQGERFHASNTSVAVHNTTGQGLLQPPPTLPTTANPLTTTHQATPLAGQQYQEPHGAAPPGQYQEPHGAAPHGQYQEPHGSTPLAGQYQDPHGAALPGQYQEPHGAAPLAGQYQGPHGTAPLAGQYQEPHGTAPLSGQYQEPHGAAPLSGQYQGPHGTAPLAGQYQEPHGAMSLAGQYQEPQGATPLAGQYQEPHALAGQHQEPQGTVSAGGGLPPVQQLQRKWKNLPPVLDGLLQPNPSLPPSTALTSQQPLVPSSLESAFHQQTSIDPLFHYQHAHHLQQQSAFTTMPQYTTSMGATTSVSGGYEQRYQQSGIAPPLDASLQPSLAWDPLSTQPFDSTTAMTADLSHQSGVGSGSDWPSFPIASAAIPTGQGQGTLSDTYTSMQQPSLAQSGSLLPTDNTLQPQYIDWDIYTPFSGTSYHEEQPTHQTVFYGSEYQPATVPQSDYGSLPSSSVPLHMELFNQPGLMSEALPPPTTTVYPPPLSGESLFSLPPKTEEDHSKERETVTSSYQLGSESRAPIVQSLTALRLQDEGPVLTNPSQPSVTSEELMQGSQQTLPLTQGSETNTLLDLSDSTDLALPAMEREDNDENNEVISEHELPETVGEEEEEEEEEEFGEMDEEDRAPGMSAFRKSLQPQLPRVDPALVEPHIVTEEYCNICGVGFGSREAAGEGGEELNEDIGNPNEGYNSHIRSTTHAQNFTLHKNFKDKYEECYSPMVNELRALVTRCEQMRAPMLTRLTDDMQDTLEKYERRMTKIEDTLNWKRGIGLIEKASDKFQGLLNRGNREYEKFKSLNPQSAVPTRPGTEVEGGGGGDSDTEFQEELNRATIVEEVEDDFTLKVRSETSKQQSRARKKSRRKKN